jgi:hypothetical protein
VRGGRRHRLVHRFEQPVLRCLGSRLLLTRTAFSAVRLFSTHGASRMCRDGLLLLPLILQIGSRLYIGSRRGGHRLRSESHPAHLAACAVDDAPGLGRQSRSGSSEEA